jgi:hypothetical protein
MKPNMPAPEADTDILFGELCAERGGLSALSVVQIAILRAMASALVGNEQPAIIARLSELLPPMRPNAASENYSLANLSKRELNWFGHLIARARGEKPLPPREYSSRNEVEMRALAIMADQASQAKRLLNDGELARLKLVLHNCMHAVVKYRVCMIFEPEFRSEGWRPAAELPNLSNGGSVRSCPTQF